MNTIYLHGDMAEKFGGPFRLDVSTPAEAIRAIAVQLDGFEEAIRTHNWQIIRGSLEDADTVDEEGLQLALGHQNEMHLIPMIEGANSGGGMIIVGIILIVAAFFTGGTSLAAWGPMATMMGAAGLGLALGGIVAMTTKVPGTSKEQMKNAAEDSSSFMFDGPVNNSKQGVAVPRGYGRMKIGSIVISAGLYAERI